MKKYILLIALVVSGLSVKAQELGYLSGFNKLGYNPQQFQPLYGFSLGKKFSKYFVLESALFYSQRSYNSDIQADYFTFMALPQFGLFKEKWGVYACPSVSLNPTLHHSNIQNHTYVSAGAGVGARILLFKKVWGDGRLLYDKGLSGAYFENGSYKNYNGIQIHLGLKFDLGCK